MARLRSIDAEKRRLSGYGPDFLEALARGLSILSAFDADKRQMTLSDVARQVDLPRATVRRALYTLEQLGYLESDGRLFRLTPKVLQLAGAFLGSSGNATALQQTCDQLCRDLNEACSAAVLDGSDAVMVAHASPPRFMSSAPGIGFRVPAFCSALGRVLIAGMNADQRDAYLGTVALKPLTPKTVTGRAELKKIIEKAARDGYALADQEAELGFRSLAVPVRRFDGRVVAALNVGVRVERATPKQMKEAFLPALLQAAQDLKERVV
ncbi:IclR family transcriptional regulator C-terminal domain-containing protein [uncultured Ferrovibrio sp.]|jgi:Transcriptional regulator|uniref:IclR family transcriptional regulator domain-containing protein n=1 Tax=uncultured Ferrovibrio sp. TaxID=1576913 RepID=UPI00262A80FF|nr:IclR family transcriptional regulator C-terminal domain-containing protein [uncultured Ferrovibrio sp.]